MTKIEAAALAVVLNRMDTRTVVTVEETRHGDRIVFSGATTGQHSLDIQCSTVARVLAHWTGYADRENPLMVGRDIGFRRGMYGRWDGRITHVGTRKDGDTYFVVSFRRVNGSTGSLRIGLREMAY
jgi:hypothetical protein